MNRPKLLSVNEFSGLSERDCADIQNELAGLVVQRNRLELDQIKTAAGIDIAYWNGKDCEYAVCCVVVIDIESGRVVEKKSAWGKSVFPYIPGCLAFRELPLVLEAVGNLEQRPDIFMFDGNGILHTRGLGLAAHASFYLDCPTLGVAKHYFKVEGADFTELGIEAGCFSDITLGGAVIGRAVRTKRNVKPVFVSVGNYIDIDTATELVLWLVGDESRIPIPTRYADLETHIRRRELSEKAE